MAVISWLGRVFCCQTTARATLSTCCLCFSFTASDMACYGEYTLLLTNTISWFSFAAVAAAVLVQFVMSMNYSHVRLLRGF